MRKTSSRGNDRLLKFKNSLRGTLNPQSAILAGRNSLHREDYFKAIDWVAATPLRGRRVSIPYFPDTYSYMYRFWAPPALDLQSEIAWACANLCPAADRLRLFRELARDLSRALLASKRDQCLELLNIADRLFGRSLWGIKNRLAILQRFDGFDAQKKLLGEIQGEAKNSGILQFLAYYISVRNEAAFSPGPFEKIYRKQIVEVGPPLESYLVWHVLEQPPTQTEEAATILSNEFVGSAIDYYETLVALAAHWFRTNLRAFEHYFREPLEYLASRVADDRLRAIVYFSHKAEIPIVKLEPVHLTPYNSFFRGCYDAALREAKAALLETPDSFEMIELAARSADCLGSGNWFDAMVGDHPFNLEIAHRMCAVLRKSEESQENHIQLQKLALNFSNLDWASSLRGFCEREMSSQPQQEAAHITLSRVLPPLRLNPLYLPVLTRHQQAFKAACETTYGNQLTTLYAIALEAGDVGLLSSDLSKSHINLARAEFFLSTGRYNDATIEASVAEPLSYFQQKHIKIRAHALLRSDRIHECIQWSATVYVRDKQLHSILPITDLVELLIQGRISGLSQEISIPILFDIYARYVSSGKEHRRQYAVEDFLESWSVTRPSELRPLIDRFDRANIIYFLKVLCVPHILDSSITYSSSSDLQSERISVCKMLTELDELNKDEYQAEITAITLEQALRRGRRHIEQTKIYVDINGIKENASRDVREGFHRYQAFQGSQYSSRQFLAELRQAIEKIHLGDREAFLLKLPKDEKSDILASIVAELRDKFVLSAEYGLNGYLSVRIRHGTFAGELRSSLEKAHILTQRERNSTEYQLNNYWPDRLGMAKTPAGYDIGRKLAAFSKQFDGIIDTIIKDWIQVRTRDENVGEFDFRINDNVRALAADITNDTTFEQFLALVLDGYLWLVLDRNLANIRKRLSEEAKDKIESSLLYLQAEVRKIDEDEDSASELDSAIVNARIDTIRALSRVTEWFNLPVKRLDEPFQITMAVNIAVETVKRFYNQAFPVPVVEAQDIEMNGILLPGIVDIFVILFDNIAKHACCEGPKVDVILTFDKKFVTILVRNSIGPGSHSCAAVTRLGAIRNALEKAEYGGAVAGEGGTGFIKIRKILDHDFPQMGASLDFHHNPTTFEVIIRLPGVEEYTR